MATKQIPLDLVRPPQDIDGRLITQQPSFLAAIKLCISLGGFEADKEIYSALDIDAGHWSRMHRGEAHFPVDKLCALMDLAGNEAPMLWLVQSRGYDLYSLRRQETELERENRLLKEELERERSERAVERRLFRDIRSAA
ncbi:hypothetical protein [Paraburkholderia gardini]|uniref:hypothetical protein n=1 Tax=Paraburkholderia gardini TaxID=2823469 RepID=UPI001E359E07|nr:hypothetical protein [Paraburkholderia gardini]